MTQSTQKKPLEINHASKTITLKTLLKAIMDWIIKDVLKWGQS